MMPKFAGGETEWHEWSGDFRTMVQTKTEMAGEAMNLVKTIGRKEGTKIRGHEVLRTIKDMEVDEDEQEKLLVRFKDLGKVTRELCRRLRLATEGEAKLVVMAEEEEGNGIKTWAPLRAMYSKKTMTTLMRLQQESMYPKQVNTEELVGAVLALEDKCKK